MHDVSDLCQKLILTNKKNIQKSTTLFLPQGSKRRLCQGNLPIQASVRGGSTGRLRVSVQMGQDGSRHQEETIHR